MKRITPVLWLYIFLLASACKTYYTPENVNWRDYSVSSKQASDSGMMVLLRPYSDRVNLTMNNVIAEVGETLEKKQPNGSLGHVLTDAMLAMAEKKFGKKVDAVFINNGGIRLTALPKGTLTIGKVYELMPFDNLVILQQLNGKQLQEFLDHIAKREGWPVSGLTYDIKNDKAVNVMIQGKPIQEQLVYTIGNSDFIANGGDDCIMLKRINQENKNILLRDAFIEYFTEMAAQGKKITPPLGDRVRKAD
jgi:2',3'-cyclic-nucleotide 2'-phosphodiesterase (5'-nucleotidase family)